MLPSVSRRACVLGAIGAAAVMFGGAGTAQANAGNGAVFTQTNDAAGNAVLAFDRSSDGRLVFAGRFPTGGLGAGTGLGSQGAVALSDDNRLLLAVDAGSNDVAAFRVTRQGLSPAGRAPSGGERPISVTVRGDDVYVLNAGGVPSVSGLELSRDGSLAVRPGVHRGVARRRRWTRAGVVLAER